MIKSHGVGKIEIDGKIYSEDLAVAFTGEVYSWERETKKVTVEDAKKFLKESPEILIIGLGENKSLKVERQVEKIAKKQEIILMQDETREAIRAFNKSIEKNRKAFGVFPLTLK